MKYHADVFKGFINRFVINRNASEGSGKQPGNDFKQCAFAATTRTHQRDKIARLDFKRNFFESVNGSRAARKNPRNVLNGNQRHVEIRGFPRFTA